MPDNRDTANTSTDATPLASEQITQEDLRRLSDAATPGPWIEREGHYRSIQGAPAGDERYGDMVTTFTGQIAAQQGQGKHNTAFIVAAVNFTRAALSATPAPSDQDASQAQGDMAAFGASEAACYFYPGEHQQAERTAFCEGAAHAVSAPGATAQDGVRPCDAVHDEDCDHPKSPIWLCKCPRPATPTIPAGMVADQPTYNRQAVIDAFDLDQHYGPREIDSLFRAVGIMLAAAPKQAEQQGVEAFKAMRAGDVKAAVRAWLDADDATHWGAFEVALDAAVEGVSERDAVVAMLQADAETMRQNATAYSEEAPTDARALNEVAATLAFKAAQIKRGDHLAALNAPTGAVEKGEAK